MAQPQPKSSPLNELCSALPSLPARLQQVGRFVAANDYDATTRSMRDLAAEAGADPASFTRLAKALGYSGWDELRAALTEARRPAPAAPFSGRTKGRRHGPNAEISLVADKLEAEAAGLGAHLGRLGGRRGEGPACRAADLDRRLSQLPQRGRIAQLSASPVPARRSATGRRLRPRRSRPRRLPARRCGRRHRLCALFEGQRAVGPRGASFRRHVDCDCRRITAPMAEGADHLLLFEAAASPGFFPSLTGAIAIAQSLAAVTFVLGGASAKRRLEETEGAPRRDVAICCRERLTVMGVSNSRVLHRSLRETPPRAVGGEGVWLIAEDGRRILDALRRRCRFLSRPSASARDRGDVAAGVEARLCPYRLFLVGAGRGAGRPARRPRARRARLRLLRQRRIGSDRSQHQAGAAIFHRDSASRNASASSPAARAITAIRSGALAAGGNAWRREPYAPLLSTAFSHVTPAFAYHEKRDDESEADFVARLAAELEAEFQRLGPDTVAAFIAEPVVGATAGCVPAPEGYSAPCATSATGTARCSSSTR